jgi:flagellar basal body P-ring formation protein FlgA
MRQWLACIALAWVLPAQAQTVAAPDADVWVAARRLHKGSAVSCGDFIVKRRRARDVPRLALPAPCAVAPASVALRELAAGDVVRTVDVGSAPDVMAGHTVRLTVATKGISVTTKATALADARVGDQIDVRLQRPTRTLKTRVIGPGSVQLVDTL